MTVLSICQAAAMKLVSQRPLTIWSSTSVFEMELQDLANEVATDIMRSHDWQALVKLAVINGNGGTDAFPFPADYSRMLLYPDTLFDAASFAFGYERITNTSEFMMRQIKGGGMSAPGIWTLFGDRFQFAPAPPAGAETAYPYIDRNYATDSLAVPKAAFTADNDGFRLPDRLLSLGLVWKWRENKGLSFGTDESNFAKAFAEEAGRDKGARIHFTGPTRWGGDVTVAYPWALGP